MSVSLQKAMSRLAPRRRARVELRAAQLIAEELTLAELRKAQKLTQQALAKLLGIKQESVSNIETRTDMLLSTLRNYVEAMGGELSLRVTFPDRLPVELTSVAAARPHSRRAKTALRSNRSSGLKSSAGA